jgi:hypothetical protein
VIGEPCYMVVVLDWDDPEEEISPASSVLGIGREPGHIRRCQSVMPLLLGIPLAGRGQG